VRVESFPTSAIARDRFILERRGARSLLDPWRHHGVVVEDERTDRGAVARVATVFLTGRECPWRCTMCDLWKHTIDTDTPPGAIPAQIAAARAELQISSPRVTTLKLYNAGSFFDPRAVPESDYDHIAAHLTGLDRVIVESHPALIGRRVDALLDALNRPPRLSALEVAIGLETANPVSLEALNKRFTVEDFQAAAASLRRRGIAVRVFLLVSPPFVAATDQDVWLKRSIDVAFESGASVVSLVPTRPGNGAMEALATSGEFREPSLADIERSLGVGLAAADGRGRVFVDLWDLARFAPCPGCYEARRMRLHSMNLTQTVAPASAPCSRCGATSS
jgi:archaeosine synthase beta-subunit